MTVRVQAGGYIKVPAADDAHLSVITADSGLGAAAQGAVPLRGRIPEATGLLGQLKGCSQDLPVGTCWSSIRASC